MMTGLAFHEEMRNAASEWNNIGLKWLKEGNMGNAKECFRQALNHFRGIGGSDGGSTVLIASMVSIPTSYPSSAKAAGEDLAQESTFSTPYTSTISFCETDRLLENPDGHLLTHLSPDSSMLYSRAIPLPTGSARRLSSHPVLDHMVCSAICVFNLALIYHLKGEIIDHRNLLNDGERQQLLKKAQALYGKCKALIFGYGLQGCISTHPVADLCAMAVLNNHALICYELFEFKKSTNDADLLVQVAATIDPSVYGDSDVGTILCQAKNEFLLNTATSLKSPTTARAA